MCVAFSDSILTCRLDSNSGSTCRPAQRSDTAINRREDIGMEPMMGTIPVEEDLEIGVGGKI